MGAGRVGWGEGRRSVGGVRRGTVGSYGQELEWTERVLVVSSGCEAVGSHCLIRPSHQARAGGEVSVVHTVLCVHRSAAMDTCE